MNIQPLQSRVVVKRARAKTTTESGIIIPDASAETPQRGVVVAVGPGSRLDNGEFKPTVVKVGDVVLYGSAAGTEVKVDDETVFIMFEEEIMGVINND